MILLSTLLALQFAQRTGQESCWTRFYAGPHRTFCIPHRNWVHWLHSSDVASPQDSDASPLKLKWKAFSHPLNLIKREGMTENKKTISFTSRLEDFNPNSGILSRGLKKIELLRERVSHQVRANDDFGILRSLLVNEKNPKTPVHFLRKLGFVHLATATGIHLYALARGWDALLRALFYYLRLPAGIGVWSSRFFSGILVFSVWLLSGARWGMLRPWILLTLRETALLFGFRWKRASPLFLALSLDFILACIGSKLKGEPLAPSGAMIYTLAVGGGLLWSKNFKSVHLGLAIGSWLLVAIWEGWHTGSVALFTPLLSLLSLPLVCFLVFPWMIVSIFLGEFGWTALSDFMMKGMSEALSKTTELMARGALSFGNLWIVSQNALMSAAFLAILICVFQSAVQKIFKYSTWVILASLILCRICIETLPKSLQIEQLDVGQGDSALVQDSLPGVGLIDSGSQQALTDSNWFEIFATRQIHSIQWAAISHLDEDHAGGFLRLVKLIPIQCIATPLAQIQSLRGQNYQRLLSKGAKSNLKLEEWNSGCIPYPTYTPPTNPQLKRANANMGAIWIPLKNKGFYLTAGDATQADEISIGRWASQFIATSRLTPQQNELQKRILKISHHGSKTSSAPKFLQILRPTEAWISAGQGNRYGHPSPQVLSRLYQMGVRIRRTDQEGVLDHQEN